MTLGVKQVFMLPRGIEDLRQDPKKFIKAIIEQSTGYYAAKKRDIKTKQKKLVSKEQQENIRYSFKIGIYS